MISWLITTVLLSWLGVAVYLLLVKRHASPWQRKWFLYTVLGSSLLAPALMTPIQDQPVQLPEEHAVVAFGQQMHGTDMHLKHFCNCENPNISHRIYYRTHHWYNVLIDYKSWIIGAILFALSLVILHLLIQYRFLFILRKKSSSHTRYLGDQKVYILHPHKPIGVGAFQLLQKPYIIWQPEMDHLSESEVTGIIAHEYSHLHQFNTLERTVLRLLQCLWLLNPALYFAKKELDLISELIADDAGSNAMRSKKAYAKLLLNLKVRQSNGLVSALQSGGKLGVRIRYLMQNRQYPGGIAAFLGIAIILLTTFASTPMLSAQVDLTLHDFATYEEIYREHAEEEEVIYCPDCETVCKQEEASQLPPQESNDTKSPKQD
ncbi:MAG: M56 family metallopeptidase [Bacteroidia bacterium]